MKIVAIIPARGRSKSIPRKNIKGLGGKPLIAYPIELAKSISQIDKVVVSTDDEEIANISKKYGAEVPFMRPEKLSDDETPTLPVLQHCINYYYNKEEKYDIVVLLYPTCPFLKKEHILNAIKLLENSETNTVLSVEEDFGRFWKMNEKDKKYHVLHPEERVNRQFYKPLYKENGAIYFSKTKVIMDMNKLVDEKNTKFIIMNQEELIDIDTPEDWKNAEKKIKKEVMNFE